MHSITQMVVWALYIERDDEWNFEHMVETMLGTELSLSSRGRMTLGVEAIFWFISHTLPQYHALQW
jgi:hypothetical protein